MPDFLSILYNCTVRWELTCICNIHKALLTECLTVSIICISLNFCVNIKRKVIDKEVVVGFLPAWILKKWIVKFLKATFALCSVIIKCAVDKCINNSLDFRISVVKLLRIVTLSLELFNVFNSCTEDVFVLFACTLCNFDVCTVICSECNCTVEHELHITCTWSFKTCCWCLLWNVSGNNNLFCIRYVVVWNKVNLEQILCVRIVVYKISNLVDVLDDCFCSCISRSSLCAKDKCCWCPVLKFVFLKSVINCHDRESVKKLSLVFVKTLNLNIKDCVRIYIITVHLLDVFSKLNFLLLLNCIELVDCSCVVYRLVKLWNKWKVCKPFVRTNLVCNHCCKLRVAKTKPTALCNTVCLVLESFRIYLIPLFKNVVFKNFCVKLSNTVYISWSVCCKSCHMNNVAVNNAHLSFHIFADALCSKLFLALVSDKANDVINFRNNLSHKVSRPFLKSLAEYCVVCISASLSCNFKCFVKVHILKHKKSYKFRYAWYRVCIVKLNCIFFCKVAEIVAMLCFITAHNVLKWSRAEEILLFKSENFSFILVVVRIKNACNIFCIVLLKNSLVVTHVVKEL